ncbi:MAG: glycosyl transferase [Candidatus Saganbacteria bacterium]|nr:glycosyl transferase [Candidatus Saganbacteria bacterium]
MKYGFFDKKNREYVITRPDTPLPWINYLGSEEYCALFSNTAGGYSFCVDPLYRRLLRYRYNNVPMDRGGRYIYIRDNKTKEYWSPTWQPVLKDLKHFKYECRHGTGYSVISSEYDGVQTKGTYFVPLGENCEVWMLQVKNVSKAAKKKNLTVFSFVEFCLWDALNDMTDFQYNLNIGQTEYTDGVIWHLTRYRVEKYQFAYLACTNQDVTSFDSDRDSFLGPYGSFENPKAVKDGKCSNSIACGWSPVGSHCVPITLNDKNEETVIFVLGYNTDKKDVKRILKKFDSKTKVEKEIQKLKEYWEESLNKFTVETEDEEMNTMLNTWNQYQCRTTFNWSRSASYYEAGIGRGMGFRDSNQDTLGFVHQIPQKVKERIIDIASTQFENGSANHQYQPLTKKGAGGGFSDDHLWLIISVAGYIKETGDFAFLSQKVPFENGKKAPMYEHLEKAIEYTMTNLGPHGLPKMFKADWNDCLNLPGAKGQSESVMVAQQLVYVAREMEKLAVYAGKSEDAEKYAKYAQQMTKSINSVAWDGSWYLRAFTDDKEAVGSSKCKEGKIYLETQPWAVMSGSAPEDRAKKCMDSVYKHLFSKHGIMILQPSYEEYPPELGTIGFYPPGLKENGAIFCHPNPWAMVAECMLGRGDRAFEYYKAILPAARNDIAEIHRTEPYVYCQMIAGRDHAKFGEGKNSWLTGSACWNFVAASQWILGIRPDYEGLMVDPCIPKGWDGFEVKRVFRGATYYITVRNPKHVSKGIKEVTVDGKKVESNVVPVFSDGGEHFVEVLMG